MGSSSGVGVLGVTFLWALGSAALLHLIIQDLAEFEPEARAPM